MFISTVHYDYQVGRVGPMYCNCFADIKVYLIVDGIHACMLVCLIGQLEVITLSAIMILYLFACLVLFFECCCHRTFKYYYLFQWLTNHMKFSMLSYCDMFTCVIMSSTGDVLCVQ